jgi:hypothetical protein
MALPDRQVLSLLHGGWARFTDKTTTTDDLLRAAGLDPVGPPDDVEAVPVTCSY